jgi:aminoglycoside phosphotransferase (APT) family kinase protein
MAPAPSEPDLDPREALAALGCAEPLDIRRVKGGWDTLLWRFRTSDDRTHSLRIYFLPGRDEVVHRERIALETCATAGLPAPRVEQIAEFKGLPALVLSWCEGLPILSFAEKRPWQLWRLARLFGRAQAQVHAVSPPSELRLEAPSGWLGRVGPEHMGLAKRAASLSPSTDALVHLDYHPLNVISDGRRVTGIVDWAGAAAGDRRADLARTYITIAAAPVPPGPMSAVLNLLRGVMLRGWRSGYRELAGPMPDYRPFVSWAGATLLAEIERVIDRPGVWGTQKDIDTLRHLVAAWEQRAAE